MQPWTTPLASAVRRPSWFDVHAPQQAQTPAPASPPRPRPLEGPLVAAADYPERFGLGVQVAEAPPAAQEAPGATISPAPGAQPPAWLTALEGLLQPSHAPTPTAFDRPWAKAETIGAAYQPGPGPLVALGRLLSRHVGAPAGEAQARRVQPLPLAGPRDEVLARARTLSDLAGEGFVDLSNPDVPGSRAAMALARMPVAHKAQMYAAARLAAGEAPDVTRAALKEWLGLSDEVLDKRMAAASEDVARIIRDSGGKAVDLEHYKRMIQAGLHARQWYEEGLPFIQQVVPASPGEPLFGLAKGTKLTARQWRAFRVLAHFSTNTPPDQNYARFMRVLPDLLETNTDAEFLARFPWRHHPEEPGLAGLVNSFTTAVEEELRPDVFITGGRKVESYFANLARRRREGYLGKRVTPVTADRHHIRAAGLPTEAVDEAGHVIYTGTVDPATGKVKNKKAASSVYLSNTGTLASSAYQIIEDMTTRAAQALGVTPEEAQAAMWWTKRMQDVLHSGKPLPQGYGFLQQHRLAQTLEKVSDEQIDAIAKPLVRELRANPGGATVTAAGSQSGQPATAVSAWSERAKYLPGKLTLDKARGVIRDNADLFFDEAGKPREHVAAGGWQVGAGQQEFAGVPVPGGTSVLEPSLLVPHGAERGAMGDVLGIAADQTGVYHLKETGRGYSGSQSGYQSTGGTGGAASRLGPVYERLEAHRAGGTLAERLASTGPAQSLSPAQHGLLLESMAELERVGKIPRGATGALQARLEAAGGAYERPEWSEAGRSYWRDTQDAPEVRPTLGEIVAGAERAPARSVSAVSRGVGFDAPALLPSHQPTARELDAAEARRQAREAAAREAKRRAGKKAAR